MYAQPSGTTSLLSHIRASYATYRMAFPLKGSSEIAVDGVAYRWRIRSRPTYDQQIDAPMTFAVQAASDPQCVLHVTTDRVRPDAWCSDGPVAVTPQLVADCIRTALAGGWDPHSPGSAFKLSAVIPR
ncbi:MAG: hypothetical protein AAF497_11075 [Planctomycetota bacterium]